MIFTKTTLPPLDSLEVSLFGTGNGESLAVHLGKGQWMLVDSCIGNPRELPLNLEYLKSLGVDFAKDVKLIVATHWHDDHVRGLSRLVECCTSAELVFSQALEVDEFMKVFGLYQEHHSFEREKSGVKEMGRCLEILLDRRNKKVAEYKPPVRTSSDKLIYKDHSSDCEVWSLSPSTSSIENAHQEIKEIWNALDKESKGGNGPRPARVGISAPDRNHNAVALWVSLGDKKVLLGADLEECDQPTLGWQAVLACKLFPNGQAGIYKIPHHGSPNGDYVPTWNQIVIADNPFACVTAYNKGKTPRPSPIDIMRILQHTDNLHYTSLPTKTALTRYNKTVERTIVGVTKSRKVLKSSPGHVQVRWDVTGNMSVLHNGAAGKA